MEITLSRVVEAARRRRAAVTAEVGGYIVLRVVQRLAASPRQVTPELVELTDAGDIQLQPSAPADAREVETGLRRILAGLVGLSQSAPPALKAAGERAASGELAALEAELLAALIPINPAAMGRALARLFRETTKATRATLPSEPGEPSSVAPVTPAPSIAAAPTPALAELDIDVEIVLAENLELAADDPDLVGDDFQVCMDDRDPDQDDLEGLLAADVPVSGTPLPTASEPRLDGPASSDRESGDDDYFAESPLPDASPFPTSGEAEPPPQRSDLRELLNGYLSHTRCEEHMTADLRRMIGLEPWRAPGALDGAKLGP